MRTQFLALSILLSTTVSCATTTGSSSTNMPEITQDGVPQLPNTTQDIDYAIQDFQQKKQTLQSRQRYASRQAQRLLPIDYFQSRNYALEADRISRIIQDIDQQITLLQQKKQQLMQPPPTK